MHRQLGIFIELRQKKLFFQIQLKDAMFLWNSQAILNSIVDLKWTIFSKLVHITNFQGVPFIRLPAVADADLVLRGEGGGRGG